MHREFGELNDCPPADKSLRLEEERDKCYAASLYVRTRSYPPSWKKTLVSLGGVTVFRTLSHYPTATDLIRTLRAHAPDVIFLSFESLEKAEETITVPGEGIRGRAGHRHPSRLRSPASCAP